MGGLGAREEDWSYGDDGEQRLAELGYGGGVVPVGIGRREAVGKLRGDEAKLLAGSVGVEQVWNGGATARVSSSAWIWAAAAFRALGVGNWQKNEG